MNKNVFDSLIKKSEWTKEGFVLDSSISLLYFILLKCDDGYGLFIKDEFEQKENVTEEVELDIFYESIRKNIPREEDVEEYEFLVNRFSKSGVLKKEKEIMLLLEEKIGIHVNRNILITATAILLYNLISHYLLGNEVCLVKSGKTIIFDEEDLYNFTDNPVVV